MIILPLEPYDDNPDGVKPGEESAVRMDPHTGMWDEPAPTPDFYVENHGSICILNPITPACIAWVEANVGNEETQHWGKHGVVVEPRYIDAIIDGLAAEGFAS